MIVTFQFLPLSLREIRGVALPLLRLQNVLVPVHCCPGPSWGQGQVTVQQFFGAGEVESQWARVLQGREPSPEQKSAQCKIPPCITFPANK